MSRYADIISRLEKAEGPNYELECLVHDAVAPDGPTWVACGSPAYTASLDAAVGLVERLGFGPEHDLDIGRTIRAASEGFKPWQVRISLDRVEDDPDETGPVALGEHDSFPIAILLALFHALQSQENSSE